MIKKEESRRDFIKKSSLFTAGVAFSGSAMSYSRIMGANDRMNVGVTGIRSRGRALTGTVLSANNTRVMALCDVDQNVLEKVTKEVAGNQGSGPSQFRDFREMIELKDLDAVVIASPDHTHTPFSVYALQNDKHVYVEKPLSHNMAEGQLLVEAQKKYGKVVQVGNQQRSAPTSMQAVKDIKAGIIGDVHTAKAWYSNARGGIGTGKVVSVPDWLDWDLYQGPAPRTTYRDNIVHYNWHWFWRWGTGEINNNGLHELDICRWALGVDTPMTVSSTGGRYYFDDDWEFYDTQNAVFEFAGNKIISWEGHSCNNKQLFNRGRGSLIYGTEGTILLDRNGYFAYNRRGELIKEMKEEEKSATTDIVGAGSLVDYHFDNFLGAVREDKQLNSPVSDINFSNQMCHLGNMAQEAGVKLEIDEKTGKVKNSKKAMELWSREYEKGWEPKI